MSQQPLWNLVHSRKAAEEINTPYFTPPWTLGNQLTMHAPGNGQAVGKWPVCARFTQRKRTYNEAVSPVHFNHYTIKHGERKKNLLNLLSTFFPLNGTPNRSMHFRTRVIWEVKQEKTLDSSEYDKMLCDSHWAQLSGKHVFLSVCGESHMLTFGNKEEWALPCLHWYLS